MLNFKQQKQIQLFLMIKSLVMNERQKKRAIVYESNNHIK
jgi:hypothetical protein